MRDVDLDAIGPDLDATDQGHQDCFDLLWRLTKLIGDLVPALNQMALSDIVVDFIVDGVEEFPSVGEECAKPVDHYRFEVARRNPSAG